MDGTTFVILSGILTFGVPLILALRELFVLRRRDGGRWDGDGSAPYVPPPAPIMGHRPLPDCLIPRLPPRPVRVRELEEA